MEAGGSAALLARCYLGGLLLSLTTELCFQIVFLSF